MIAYDLKQIFTQKHFTQKKDVCSITMCCIITRCLSLPKRNDKKCLKNAFFSPFTMTQNPFWVSRNHIQWKKGPKFSQMFMVRLGGGPPPSYGQPDRKKAVLVFDDFPKPFKRVFKTSIWWPNENTESCNFIAFIDFPFHLSHHAQRYTWKKE